MADRALKGGFVFESIVVSDNQELQFSSDDEFVREPKLSDLYPEEVEFFKRTFIWASNTEGFYTRQRYHTVYDHLGNPLPKWQPFRKYGEWQPLYPELVDSLAEKHLDFERFCGNCEFKDRLRPAESESAFWLGTMAGKRTVADCIDLDSHDVVGWAYLPTRWHPDNTGWAPGPYDDRTIPVVRPSLAFFMRAKLIHDHFPGRIWAFSSANLGLAIWDIRRYPESTHVVHRRTTTRLERVGLSGVEHYPLPARSAGSLGKTHRRPCGMDSGIVTSAGIVTDPIEQIRLFMRPPKTPPFECILDTYLTKLRQMYSLFLSQGYGTRLEGKRAVVQDCEKILQEIQDWASQGCRIDWELIQISVKNEPAHQTEVALPEAEPTASEVFAACTDELGFAEPLTEYPQCFFDVDLKQVASSGQWVQFVKFLVENGFPKEDKFSEVVSALALWFGFVEWFGQERDKITELLTAYVFQQHNSMVTRLLAGNEQDVIYQIGRIVDHALDKENDNGRRLFAEIRQKRANGKYRRVYSFAQQILSNEPSTFSFLTPHSLPSYLLCRVLTQDQPGLDGDSQWRYVPDLTPLPDDVLERIRQAFRQAKRQLRRNKGGRYPTLDAITCLFNYLYSGRTSGTRRASQKLLVEMGFPEKSAKRTPIFTVLKLAELLHPGGYRAKSKSRLWMLDKSVIEAMFLDRATKTETA